MSDEVVLIDYGHVFVKVDAAQEFPEDETVNQILEYDHEFVWYKCTRCGLVSFLPNPSLLRLNHCDDMILRQVMNS